MVARNWSGIVPAHSLRRIASELSSVITSTRRIEAISPTMRNGSAVSVPVRMEARTVCRISISMSTNSSRSTISNTACEPVQSSMPCQSTTAVSASASAAVTASRAPITT